MFMVQEIRSLQKLAFFFSGSHIGGGGGGGGGGLVRGTLWYFSLWHGHRLCTCMPGHPLGTFIGHRIICSGVWSSW